MSSEEARKVYADLGVYITKLETQLKEKDRHVERLREEKDSTIADLESGLVFWVRCAEVHSEKLDKLRKAAKDVVECQSRELGEKIAALDETIK